MLAAAQVLPAIDRKEPRSLNFRRLGHSRKLLVDRAQLATVFGSPVQMSAVHIPTRSAVQSRLPRTHVSACAHGHRRQAVPMHSCPCTAGEEISMRR